MHSTIRGIQIAGRPSSRRLSAWRIWRPKRALKELVESESGLRSSRCRRRRSCNRLQRLVWVSASLTAATTRRKRVALAGGATPAFYGSADSERQAYRIREKRFGREDFGDILFESGRREPSGRTFGVRTNH